MSASYGRHGRTACATTAARIRPVAFRTRDAERSASPTLGLCLVEAWFCGVGPLLQVGLRSSRARATQSREQHQSMCDVLPLGARSRSAWLPPRRHLRQRGHRSALPSTRTRPTTSRSARGGPLIGQSTFSRNLDMSSSKVRDILVLEGVLRERAWTRTHRSPSFGQSASSQKFETASPPQPERFHVAVLFVGFLLRASPRSG